MGSGVSSNAGAQSSTRKSADGSEKARGLKQNEKIMENKKKKKSGKGSGYSSKGTAEERTKDERHADHVSDLLKQYKFARDYGTPF